MNSIVIDNTLYCYYDYAKDFSIYDGEHFVKGSGAFVSVVFNISDKVVVSQDTYIHNGELCLIKLKSGQNKIYTSYVPRKYAFLTYKLDRALCEKYGDLVLEDDSLRSLFGYSTLPSPNNECNLSSRWSVVEIFNTKHLIENLSNKLRSNSNCDSIRYELLSHEILTNKNSRTIYCNCSKYL